MQRKLFLSAYLFFCANCLAQQYPFVHYTPKDGLISNSIRGVYQDSKGRLFFNSINGLSVYDGARFINYSAKNGLEYDIVNCVMEMGEDSLWVVSNDKKIYSLANGKLRQLTFKEPPPLIDNLVRDEKGALYAASEEGLFLFRDNRFVRLPVTDLKGKSIDIYLGSVISAGKYFLLTRDNLLVNGEDRYFLYLYNKETGKIVAQTKDETIYLIAKAPDGRIWVSTNEKILAIDTMALKDGMIIFQKLPARFNKIENKTAAFISFDKTGNCWLSDKVFDLIKIDTAGHITSFTPASGLSSMDIGNVIQDKEGSTWITNYTTGVDKLVHNNFAISADVFGVSKISSISFSPEKKELFLYSSNNAKAIIIGENNRARIFDVKNANRFQVVLLTPEGYFGFSDYDTYRLNISGNQVYPTTLLFDTIGKVTGSPLVDKNGNLVLCSRYYLTVVIDKKNIYRKKTNFYDGYIALDTSGNIWIASRSGELSMYHPDTNDPAKYLEEEIVITKQLPGISPRALIIDKQNNIWIGTRKDGIHVFKMQDKKLIRQFYLNQETRLSDNFITHLACDSDNTIWASSPSGLDKISLRNGIPVVENITKQNNLYEKVYYTVIDHNNNVWAMVHNGLLKITSENKPVTGYIPSLAISMIKSGKDTITSKGAGSFAYKLNNLAFYFGATSYLDEKQILYSYQLLGSSNTQWSEPSNTTTVSFIDLQPGNYTLNVKANFPAGRYPEQTIQYKFSITPPWWQTGLFRSAALLVVIWMLIFGVRFYYRRKLDRQMAVLEKKQAIEKERTRIATDMHDDLGAGLSRIKFLSETIGIKQQQQKPFEEDISKIREYSHEMIDKMGEIVWALNEKNDSLSDLLSYTRSYAVEYLSQNGIKCRIETPDKFPAGFVSGEFRRNIYLTVKEALHNVVKHAQASEVLMKIEINHNLNIEIKDDGTGFDKSAIRPFSNGLSNMRSRIKEIGGVFEIKNGNGTLIRIKVPLNG
jgi:signal transduction histidine kinase/ligand-binding sensor domain-containing protein